MRMQLPAQFATATYYGRGPWSNYSDRKTSTFVDRYTENVGEMNEKYVFAQESGHHTDTKWIALSNNTGKGLLIASNEGTFEFNTSNVLLESIDNSLYWNNDAARLTAPEKKHINAYTASDRTDLFIDHKMQGVGGNNSWGQWPEEPYRIVPANTKISYGFTIIPIDDITKTDKLLGK